ncbi:unnamed protein product [Symbiodinium necroappetens]|uniref:Uncharacterized protein n=1 Tax=Symbiodinium necroappetens TaxID=1628268 RepID=A0A813A3A5_9DINO|nr:unnamed protein product [Symbiodinium necroappetens]
MQGSDAKSLEAKQIAEWVEQLDLENQVLRECISRCADTLINAASNEEDRNLAISRRKGLAVLLANGPGHDIINSLPSRAHLRAKQLLQSRGLQSANSPLPEHAGEVELELERSRSLLEDQLRQQRTRYTALEVEVDALQRDLAATRERQQMVENTQLEERLRHDALIMSEMHQLQLELYQLDEEAVALGPKIQQMRKRGLAVKALGRLLKFLTSEGFTREVLWRWRFLLSP